ncbi:MAG: CDP-alcohol phosphatidyltransferase family protein [Gemmatimonadota bacterium]|nr:CDP-alcohol phosphatidyltransferase family protein [Gemmatimonadota bacterium]MDE2984384.1 CDP-alcohol phosphatidyltransferase family protein [Gemmatimonadota bacterium]
MSATVSESRATPAPPRPRKSISSLREPVQRVIGPVTRWLIRRRVHPNAITVLGFVVTVVGAVMFSQDHVHIGGILILLGGLLDVFDGSVARESGLASKFGAFFDATLDRISEIAMYIGLMTLYNAYQLEFVDIWMIYIITLALGGSLMVSYTRAKAESLGFDCSVGLMERGERILVLGLGAAIFGLAWDGMVLSSIIVIVALLTNATAIQRMFWVYRRGTGVPLDDGGDAAGKA